MKHAAKEKLKHDQKIKSNLMKFRTGNSPKKQPIKMAENKVKSKPISDVLKNVEAMLKEFRMKIKSRVNSL